MQELSICLPQRKGNSSSVLQYVTTISPVQEVQEQSPYMNFAHDVLAGLFVPECLSSS